MLGRTPRQSGEAGHPVEYADALIPLLEAIPSDVMAQRGMVEVIGDDAYDSELLYRAVKKRGATLLMEHPFLN